MIASLLACLVGCTSSTPPHESAATGADLGQAAGSTPSSSPSVSLAVAVDKYARYVNVNAGRLVRHTQDFCAAVDAGDLTRAEHLYPPAREFYERIEPVATTFGSLADEIDGRWHDPAMVASQFVGFHRIEQMLWADHTLDGAPAMCRSLVQQEQQLSALVSKVQYAPLQMAAGARELMTEAADSKLTGEEERYSHVALPELQANIDGSMEVVAVLRPHLEAAGQTAAVQQILERRQQLDETLARFRTKPGYLATGYPSYTKVTLSERRTIIAAVVAFAEALSKLPALLG